MSDAGVNVSTGDPTVDAILQGGTMPAANTEPVGGIWNGPTGPVDPTTGEFVGPLAQTVPNGIAAPYSADYVTGLWEGLPLEDRVRLQDRLVGYGLTSKVVPGELDDGTLDGIGRLLGMSNRAGTTWQATLGRLEDLEAQGLLDAAQREQPFEAQPYLAPDYATMAQTVKDMFRQRLGREPDQSEMAQFQAELTGWDRMGYEAEQDLQRIQHEQAQQPGAQAAPTGRAVDPLARFQEVFESRYANELDFVEDKADAVETREQVQQTTNTLSRMSGGQA